jgi:cytoskeletal protein RodZ
VSIGAALHAARQEAGLSVDDVAIATRIRATLIRQIEADNFEACGGAIYARGHIRSIAGAVGIDPAPLVAEFNETHGAPSALSAHQILDHTEIVQRPRTGPNWTAAMLVVAVLLAVVAGVSLFTNPNAPAPTTATSRPAAAAAVVPSSEPTGNAANTPDGTTTDAGVPSAQPLTSAPAGSGAAQPSQPAASVSASAPPSSAPPTVVAFNGVNVRVSVTGSRCWVRATDLSSKKVLYQGVLEHGNVRDFTAPGKISMQFGNAGAVALNVNGRDLGVPGGVGQVVTLRFGPGDPSAG